MPLTQRGFFVGQTRYSFLELSSPKLVLQVLVGSGFLDHVHFTGFRSDVLSILSRVDVLCLPSTSEGLPYSVIEAARQSVPTLASRLEGTDDIFVDGKTILFTRIGDAEDICEKLAFLLDNPERRRDLGAAARRMFLTDLGVERMLDETLEIYTRATRPEQDRL